MTSHTPLPKSRIKIQGHCGSAVTCRHAGGGGRGGCQGDVVIIRVLAGATTLLGTLEIISVATATAIRKHSTSAISVVVIPANEAAATCPDRHRLLTGTCG